MLLEEIKKVITEEQGISTHVTDAMKMVKALIIKDSKNQEFETTELGDYCKSNTIKNIKFYNKVTIDITYQIIYIDTQKELNVKIYQYPSKGNYNPYLGLLSTMLFYVKETNQYIDTTTQHELEHMFQMAMSGKSFFSKEKNFQIYEKAKYNFINSKTKLQKIISASIYYANKFEMDAFTNEIYSDIIQNKNMNPLDVLTKTAVYKNVKYIEDCLPTIFDSENLTKSAEKFLVSEYGKHFNWWYNLTKKMIKNYTNKIGKVVFKAQKDLLGGYPDLTNTNIDLTKQNYEN